MVRGDTYAALAVRKRAFLVAKLLLEKEVDPLIENDEGDDLFELLKMIYGEMAQDLRDIDAFRRGMADRIVVPTEVVEMERREEAIKDHYVDLLPLIEVHSQILQDRLVSIEECKYTKRKLELSHNPVPPYLLWKISTESRIHNHLEHTEGLVLHIKQKIKMVDDLEHSDVSVIFILLRTKKNETFEKS